MATKLPREQIGFRNVVSDLRRIVEAQTLGAIAAPAPTAAAVYQARRARARIFGADAVLFSDPAWDILLDLYASAEAGKRVTVGNACIAGEVPHTTGLRYVAALVQHGLARRVPDSTDGRRCWLELTDRGTLLMEQWLAAIA